MQRKKIVLAQIAIAALGIVTAGEAFADDAVLERGRYLANSIVACGNCHTPQGPEGPLPGMEFAGGMVIDMAGMFTANVPNITPDAETGIGSWTDEQIAKAIREGLRPDGSLIGPPMPFGMYRDISDSDVMALVAYLRSVAPVKNKVAKSSYQIPLPPAYGPPVTSVPDVPRADKVAYGAYLAGPLGHCVECHTPMGAGDMPDFANKFAAGGMEIPGPWGISITANITPDPKTGIGGWSDADIKKAITAGVRPDGAPLAPPMPFGFYHNMTEEDLDAIVAYLRSLKPIENAVR
jgi:mono/diheme cytochrome c family protein